MKRFNLKVENSSKYWMDFEGELSVYYHLKWIGEVSINRFTFKKLKFIKEYVSITHKYGLAVPINYNEQNLLSDYLDYKQKNEAIGIRGSNLMSYLYSRNQEINLVYSSKIFTDVNDTLPKDIICIDPYLELKDIGTIYMGYGARPLRIELLKSENKIEVVLNLDNDIFNSWIDNKKTKRDPEIGGKGYWVDNSDLAYLNTPRFNSFLRDLKKLCFEYGATDFEFEDLGLNDFTENGVLFNDEVLFYEDIYDLLPEEHKYKPFEVIQLE